MDLSLVDAFYFVGTTVTTVGYGDITPLKASPALKLYAVLLMLFGSATLATLTSILTAFVVTERFEKLLGRRRVPSEGHVVVVGLGNVGNRTLAGLARCRGPRRRGRCRTRADRRDGEKTRAVVVVGDARERRCWSGRTSGPRGPSSPSRGATPSTWASRFSPGSSTRRSARSSGSSTPASRRRSRPASTSTSPWVRRVAAPMFVASANGRGRLRGRLHRRRPPHPQAGSHGVRLDASRNGRRRAGPHGVTALAGWRKLSRAEERVNQRRTHEEARRRSGRF